MGESFTIQISSNLVSRLAGDGDKVKKKTKKPKPKIPETSQQLQSKSRQKQIQADTQKGTPSGGWSLQSPLFLPITTPPSTPANEELEGIRSILLESEGVLEKLQKQESKMLQEVKQKAKELHEKEFKVPNQKAMPCLAEKDACQECYKEHAKDPLKCADVVKTFADCACKARWQVSSPVDK